MIPDLSCAFFLQPFSKLVPAIVNWQAVEDILKEELESTWLTDKDPAQALSDAEARINDQLAQ